VASRGTQSVGVGTSSNADSSAPDIYKARDKLIAMLGIRRGEPYYVPSKANPHRQSQIVGIGVGYRFTQKTLTHEQVIKVFVSDKLRESDIDPDFLIPKRVDGFRTDVEESGTGRPHSAGGAFSPQPFSLPVKCGVACGVEQATEVGTIGCLVQMKNGDVCILSNNHILAYGTADNSPSPPDLQGRTYRIFQPGPSDGSLIGVLEDYVPYKTAESNLVDAAVAKTASDLSLVDAAHMTYKVNSQVTQATLGMVVTKDGMRTANSIGMITDVGLQQVPMGVGGGVFFDEVIAIRGIGGAPFSLQGDSGSLIVELATKRPVALLIGGVEGRNITYANPIDQVMDELAISRVLSPDDVKES